MHDHHDDSEPAVCRIGGHRHPGDGRVCDPHLQRMRAELAGVARMTRELPTRLVPGSAPGGERVSTTRTGSPPPVDPNVLSMLAAGGAEVRRDARMLAPQVRRWSTLSTYDVTVANPDPNGPPITERRQLRTWHAETVTDGTYEPVSCNCGRPHLDGKGQPIRRGRPLLVMDDDQVGSIPPAEWADMWVRRLRLALQDTTSLIRGQVSLACDADQRRRVERVKIGEALRSARRSPTLMPAVAQLIAFQRAYQQHLETAAPRIRMALLGVRDDGPAHQARVAAALAGQGPLPGEAAVIHDPVAAEWSVRYGYAGVAAAVEVDTCYLAEWLPLLAEHDDPDSDVDIAVFARDLRHLHSELEYLLDESSDLRWIGRCPAYLRDTDGEETDRICGARIWQDPYRSVIDCPRCLTGWPEAEWLHLANLIRVRWPIDRRRRYTQGDRVAAEKCVDRLPRCSGCERVMTVEWAETSGRRDQIRTWSPTGFACPSGCIAGGVSVAA